MRGEGKENGWGGERARADPARNEIIQPKKPIRKRSSLSLLGLLLSLGIKGLEEQFQDFHGSGETGQDQGGHRSRAGIVKPKYRKKVKKPKKKSPKTRKKRNEDI